MHNSLHASVESDESVKSNVRNVREEPIADANELIDDNFDLPPLLDFFIIFGISHDVNFNVSTVALCRTKAPNAGSNIGDVFRFDLITLHLCLPEEWHY